MHFRNFRKKIFKRFLNFLKFFWNFLKKFWIFFENFLENSLYIFWKFFENFVNFFWKKWSPLRKKSWLRPWIDVLCFEHRRSSKHTNCSNCPVIDKWLCRRIFLFLSNLSSLAHVWLTSEAFLQYSDRLLYILIISATNRKFAEKSVSYWKKMRVEQDW